MSSKRRTARSLLRLALAPLLLAAACTHLAVPDAVPAVEEYRDVALAGAKVAVVSVEKDDAEFLIYRSSRHGSFMGNRKVWCDALATALAAELTKRGATVAADAATRVELTLPEITGHSGYATVGFKVKAVAACADGWTRSYDGSASAAAGFSMGGIADRSASYSNAEIVRLMLADPEFVAKVRAATSP
jgi:hypothetical protein